MLIHSNNTPSKEILKHGSRTMQGCLVQLGYLGELVSDASMKPDQKRELLQQIHVIRVNTEHGKQDVDQVINTTRFIEHLGTTTK